MLGASVNVGQDGCPVSCPFEHRLYLLVRPNSGNNASFVVSSSQKPSGVSLNYGDSASAASQESASLCGSLLQLLIDTTSCFLLEHPCLEYDDGGLKLALSHSLSPSLVLHNCQRRMKAMTSRSYPADGTCCPCLSIGPMLLSQRCICLAPELSAELASGAVSCLPRTSMLRQVFCTIGYIIPGQDGVSQGDMDPTPTIFDNLYFRQLLQGGGSFQTDKGLLQDQQTAALVQRYASNQSAFFQDFTTAYEKMSLHGVAT